MVSDLKRSTREFMRVYEQTGCSEEDTRATMGLSDADWLYYATRCKSQMVSARASQSILESITADSIKILLWEISQDPEYRPTDRVAAVRELNKMCGWDAPPRDSGERNNDGISKEKADEALEIIFGS